MAEATSIEWCDATFNPWWGCTKVSPACDHCYAERDARRFQPGRVLWGVDADRRTFGDDHWEAPRRWARTLPAKLGRRPRVFCASMADVFDKEAPRRELGRLLELIDTTPELDWLLLTKRIGNVGRLLHEVGPRTLQRGAAIEVRTTLPRNVWLGATVVNQEEANRDIPKLLAVPASVRFLSIEPMLSDIRLGSWLQRSPSAAFAAGKVKSDVPAWTRIGSTAIDWVICGGESGPHARPMHPDWTRSLRDECAAAGVPFLFKQWGEWVEADFDGAIVYAEESSGAELQGRRYRTMRALGNDFVRAGRKDAGRLLDGIEHNGFPA